jgi:tetratricopeptide (TPR) repeat protein
VAKHLRAASWIEALDTPADTAELVAHHYAAASQLSPGGLPPELHDRARTAFADAGNRALVLGAPVAAAGYYRSALDLAPTDDPERGRLLFQLGRSLFSASGEGVDELQAAIPLLEAADDRTTAAEAEALLTVMAWSRADPAWRSHLDRAMAFVADAPPSRAKATVLATRARRLVVAGDNEGGLAVAREALAMADQVAVPDVRAHALNSIGLAVRATGEGDGYAELRESVAIYEQLRSIDITGALNNLGSALETDGRLREAMEAGREASRVGRRFGGGPWVQWARFDEVDNDFLLGQWDDAVRRADALIAEAEAGSDHYLVTLPLMVRSRIRIARGDVAGALADCEAHLSRARAIGDTQSLLPALASSFATFLEAGDTDRARELANELVPVQQSGRIVFRAPAYVISAHERLGLLAEVLASFRGARRTPWLEAAERVAAGDWVGAAEVYERIESPTDLAVARFRAAEQLVGAGRRSEADAQLAGALQFFRSVGATRYLREAESLRAATA